ncbi:T9SS type B sorting domain-containing protein [Formosa sp. S-31]|uniref:T9SS type B sorting domain-containing protein n=1 Tax=Formosa sp. S-31 TaxID=2790949 RepID=UPI003EBC2697
MKSIKIISIFIIFIYSLNVFSQKESAFWFFGDHAGLNFNTEPPTPLTNGQLNTKEGCSAISDANGNLLFYSDGVRVWDRRHQLMPNGNDLLGHISSTESAIIIPSGTNRNIYYIFTIDVPSEEAKPSETPYYGINYSKVDMSLNNGYGDIDVNTKNIHLVTYEDSDSIQKKFKSSEKITAVTNASGDGIWVITQFVNKFYAFLVDYSGVNLTPVISTVPQTVHPRLFDFGPNPGTNPTAIGYIKVSPNGKNIAIAHSSTSLGSIRSGTKKSGKVLLYNFNNANGKVSNEKLLLDGEYPYGVEFSPNSKVLYITSAIYEVENDRDIFKKGLLYQYNLGSSDIKNSQTTINSSNLSSGALQLAINGKIYRTGYDNNISISNLSVIKSPNEIGPACNYSHKSVSLNNKNTYIGLPPFVQSIFLYTFDYKYTCLGDFTEFTITSEDPYDSAIWDFGDGSTSTNTPTTTHQYTSPGTYTVKLTMSISGISYTPLIKQVTISDIPDVITGTYNLETCDAYDDDPSDGIASFNLNEATPNLLTNTSNFLNANFYHSVTEAENDTLNINYLNPIYKNTSPNEIVVAKVSGINQDCYALVPIKLTATPSTNLDRYTLEGCDIDRNGESNFDLSLIKTTILNDLGDPNISISLHNSLTDAAVGSNPLPDFYSTSDSSIFIRARKNNQCFGSGVIDLVSKSFPAISDHDITICKSEFPVAIDSGISSTLSSLYNYSWNTSDTTNTIMVTQPGVYNVTITDPTINCSIEVKVTVNEIQFPEIANILINGSNMEVKMNHNPEHYEFSISDLYYSFSGNPYFTNLPPGKHTLQVKDIRNCNIISQDFSILSFPKYFTPNNDGYHDYWNVLGLESVTSDISTTTIIFNRFGKIIKQFKPFESNGWDGTFNGEQLPADDYWYYIKIPNGKEYKGHFTLKR